MACLATFGLEALLRACGTDFRPNALTTTSHPPVTTELNRNAIRRLVRERRRALGSRERARLSEQLADNVTRSPLFRNSHTLAIYLPNDGEVDLTPVARAAWSMGKQCFLPVLSPLYHNRLWFAPYTPESGLELNRFGIPEPALNWRAM